VVGPPIPITNTSPAAPPHKAGIAKTKVSQLLEMKPGLRVEPYSRAMSPIA